MIEEKTVDKIEKSAARLTIKVSAETTQQVYDEILDKYKKQAHMPGFRKGKVPDSILVRKFGEGMNQEATSKVIEGALSEALENLDIQPISQPVLNELHSVSPGTAFEFAVIYDVFPEISIGNYVGIEVEKPQVSILEKHENRQLELIREQNAVVIAKSDGIIAEGSIITMDHVELDSEGADVENTRRKDFVFTLGKNEHPYAIEDDLKGLKVDEEVVLHKIYDDEDRPSLKGREIKLRITIKAVKELCLPDLDDELAQDVSATLKTLDDLRAKVHKTLQKHAESALKNHIMKIFDDKLLTDSVIELPQSLVNAELENHWGKLVSRSGGSENELLESLEGEGLSKKEVLGKLREEAERVVKIQLIHGKIIEEENLNINDEEIHAEIGRMSEEKGVATEEYEKLFGYPEYREYLRDTLASEKLLGFLLNSATVQSGTTIDFDELMSV